MTVAATEPIKQYSYTGPGDYPFNFQAFDETDLKCYIIKGDTGEVISLAYITDYTVSLLPDFSAGTVTVTWDGEHSGVLEIRRELAYVQETDWVNNYAFDMDLLERAFDRIIMLLQQMNTDINYTLTPTNWRGTWAFNVLYEVSDMVSTSNGNIYSCAIQHVSTASFANDLNSGYWKLVVNIEYIEQLTAQGEAAAAAALASEGAAALSAASADADATEVAQLKASAELAEANAAVHAQNAANCEQSAYDSALRAEDAANAVVVRRYIATVGIGGQTIFNLGFNVDAAAFNVQFFADGVLQYGAFPCDSGGVEATTGFTPYVSTGSSYPEGTDILVLSASSSAINDISGFVDTFDTLAAMQAQAPNLVVGRKYRILGREVKGDGGHAEYLIIAGNTGDGYGNHNIGANTAVLLINSATNVVQFGALPDGVDRTANVIAAAKSIGVRGGVYIPPNVRYNFNTLMTSPDVPVECIFYDQSARNGGYLKDKLVGVYEKGDPSAESDTTYVVSSGHNAGIALDNTGLSGSSGALSRIGVLAWTAGRMAKGAIVGLIRSVARLEFAKSSVDSNRWAMVLRKRAPMTAVSANYSRWTSGMSVTIDDHVFHVDKYYVAASNGVTGVTPPTHSSGTVSDGGVDWTYVQFSYDATAFYVDDLGRIGVNTIPTTGSHFQRWKQSPDDTNPFIIQYEPFGVSKSITYRGRPTDGAGSAVTIIPDLVCSNGGWSFISSTSSTLMSVADSGVSINTFIEPATTVTSGATPSVLNRASLILTYGAATNVTNLTDGVTNQVVTLIASNGNATLINGTGFRLAGGVDAPLTAFSAITLKKTSLTSAWVEISRSIK